VLLFRICRNLGSFGLPDQEGVGAGEGEYLDTPALAFDFDSFTHSYGLKAKLVDLLVGMCCT
jgi:hypothetical protein